MKRISTVPQETALVSSTAESKEAGSSDKVAKRIHIRRRIIARLYPVLYVLPGFLIAGAVVLLFVCLPSPVPPFQRKTYVDENALAPAHSHVYWAQDSDDVARADNISAFITGLAGSNSSARADSVASVLRSYGLQAEIQSYTITLPPSSRQGASPQETRQGSSTTVEGTNVYARWNSPRTNGRESIVIAAPWISSWDGRNNPWFRAPSAAEVALTPYERTALRKTNVRGIASVLALSKFLTKSNYWSKDLIFIISDGHLAGMQAWTNAYFSFPQSNIRADPISASGSQIWNAIIVDYPSDSFSALEIQHEGLNGALPNMDVLNTFVQVSQSMGVETRMPADWEVDESISPQWRAGGQWGSLGAQLEKVWWKHKGVAKYRMGAKNLARQISFLGSGHPSGLHGLFHRFHVDAFTVFAVPAKGPFGFAHIGRILESQLRSYSNLLERLHHSQFFYLLTSPHRFVQIGLALPIALLVSAALTLIGLQRISSIQHLVNEAKDSIVQRAKRDIEQLAAAAGAQQTGQSTYDELEHPSDVDRLKDVIAHAATFAKDGKLTLFAPALERLASDLRREGVPFSPVMAFVVASLAFGAAMLLVATRIPVDCAAEGLYKCKPFMILSSLPLLGPGPLAMLSTLMLRASPTPPRARPIDIQQQTRRQVLAHTLYAFCALFAGIALAVTALLNFSLAIMLAMTVGVAISLNSPGALPSAESLTQASEEPDSAKGLQGSLRPSKQRFVRHVRPYLVLLVSPPALLHISKHLFSPTIVVPRYFPSFGGQMIANPVHDFMAWHLLRTRPPTASTMYAIREAADIKALHGWGAERALNTLLWDYHVLRAATLPYLALVWTPLILLLSVACTLGA